MNPPTLTHCTRDTFDGKLWHHVEFQFMCAGRSQMTDEQFIAIAERRDAELKRGRAG
jgi:hypothetical protein